MEFTRSRNLVPSRCATESESSRVHKLFPHLQYWCEVLGHSKRRPLDGIDHVLHAHDVFWNTVIVHTY